MGHVFLSDGWFDEAEKIRAEANPEVPAAVQGLVINLVVKDGPDGDIEARMDSGRFVKGLSADAPTKLTVPRGSAIATDGKPGVKREAPGSTATTIIAFSSAP